jgi:hypothetical protein
METQCSKNIVDMFPYKLVDQIQDKNLWESKSNLYFEVKDQSFFLSFDDLEESSKWQYTNVHS